MMLSISNLFKKNKFQTKFSKSNHVFDAFIKINGSRDEVLKKIENYGLGYKIEQYKLSNFPRMLNTIEIQQIFGKKQFLELSNIFNLNEEVIKDEILNNIGLLIPKNL